jgi:hypothetical protein
MELNGWWILTQIIKEKFKPRQERKPNSRLNLVRALDIFESWFCILNILANPNNGLTSVPILL